MKISKKIILITELALLAPMSLFMHIFTTERDIFSVADKYCPDNEFFDAKIDIDAGD